MNKNFAFKHHCIVIIFLMTFYGTLNSHIAVDFAFSLKIYDIIKKIPPKKSHRYLINAE